MLPPKFLLSYNGDHESKGRVAPQAVRLGMAKPGVAVRGTV